MPLRLKFLVLSLLLAASFPLTEACAQSDFAVPQPLVDQIDEVKQRERDELERNLAAKINELTGDVSIIVNTPELIDSAKKLIDKVNEAENSSKNSYLAEIRSLRAKLTKRAPQLRTLLDNLRRTKENLGGLTAKVAMDPAVPNESINIGGMTLDLQGAIEAVKTEIEKARGPNGLLTGDGPLLEIQLQDLLRRKASAEAAMEKRKTEFEKALAEEEKDRRELSLISERIQRIIMDGDKASRELDENLNILDDLTSSLIQSDVNEAEYTNWATTVFGILVGVVIIAFFIIAFTSEPVKNAIFAGDSGIQFITMFVLVIAIILFGVLKILEGRELAALLGGLSGYILGRGSQYSRAKNEPPPGDMTPKDTANNAAG